MMCRSPRLIAVVVGLLGCSNATAPPAHAGAASASGSTRRGDLAAAISTHLSQPIPEFGPLSGSEREALASLYTPDAQALWTDAAGLTKNAHEALRLLEGAASEGLEPREYRSAWLTTLGRTIDAPGTRPAPDALAVFDVVLSTAMLRYFRHLHFGRVDPRTLGLRLHVPAERHDVAVVLRAAIAQERIAGAAAELAPPLAQYRELRHMLVRYRSLAADPTIPPAPDIGGVLRPGDPAAISAMHDLSRRLVALGDLPADVAGDAAVYEGPLVDAVRRFQSRHGLEPDGVLGRATAAALAVPLSWRLRQIELALERLRWLPDVTNERVLALNIPMFQLWAWDATRLDGQPAFATRAIVGRARHAQTPVFVEELREVVFRPYWNVPRSILRSEILPRIGTDPAYLEREDMEIVEGSGDDARAVPVNDDTLARLAAGALRLRQRPGPRNALGLVKFVFPNDDNVYLHSTPAQALFSRARRDFSHGCVRVEDPVSLAEWVLKEQAGWTRERILAAMSGPAPQRVALARPIQVVLFYTTAAVVPAEGAVHFAEDVYHQDAALDRALVNP
jgi:murein L,D-transpeptidase YcbB/YkuD